MITVMKNNCVRLDMNSEVRNEHELSCTERLTERMRNLRVLPQKPPGIILTQTNVNNKGPAPVKNGNCVNQS